MTKQQTDLDRLLVLLQALEADDWEVLMSRARAARKGRDQGGILLPAKEVTRLRDFFLQEGIRCERRSDGIFWVQFPASTHFLYSCLHATLPTGNEFVVVPRGSDGGPAGAGREVFQLPRRNPEGAQSSKSGSKRRRGPGTRSKAP